MNLSRVLPLPFKKAQAKTGSQQLCLAMVAPSLDILGGQGVQARSLEKALTRDGFRVLFIPVNPSFPWGLGWLRRIPILRTLLNELLYIVSLHKLRHADVVHIFSASYWSFLLAPVPAIVAARLFGKRIILNYHSGEAGDHLANWGIRVHPWLRLVDEIVVPSHYLQEEFANFGYQVKVVHNIIDTTRFFYRERQHLRPLLFSNRNLERHYCVDNTLKAFAILKKTWPEAELVIVGYGSEEARLKRWVRDKKLDGVEFLGRIEPSMMSQLYNASDIFINSSVTDNQPISILEAFTAGLPVISTPTGDIPSMVDNGKTGTLVAHNSPQAMADAIILLLESELRAAVMARCAREQVEKYTWPCVSREWIELYSGKQGETATTP